MTRKENRYAQASRRFPEDVKEHVLTIVLDNGVYRHLICAKPSDCCCRFEIVTFPGYLVIVGDYGSFTFWRLNDMFNFFDKNQIDFQYWCSKLVAVDKNDGAESFSEDEMRESLLDYMDVKSVDELSGELTDLYNSGSEYDFGLNLQNCHEDNIYDLGSISVKEHSYYFIWCCHAIVWAIREYRKMKGENNER